MDPNDHRQNVGSSNTSTNTTNIIEGVGKYDPLCRAIQMADWEKTLEFLHEDKDLLTNTINVRGFKPIHVAIGNPKNIWLFEKLLDMMNAESLPNVMNNNQQNALHYAAILDNTIAAQKLVEKNPHLLFKVDYEKALPLQRAIFNAHKTTFLYLLQASKRHIALSQQDGNHNPFVGENGVSLMDNVILSGFLDVAYDLLKEYPELARTYSTESQPPLWAIAKMWDAYPSAKRYNFYQRFVYSHIPAENYDLDHTNKVHDMENQEAYKEKPITKSYFYPAMKNIYAKFWKIALLHVPHIKRLQEDKIKQNTALQILKFICKEVDKLKSHHFQYYGQAFIVAVKNNTPEVIEQITRFFPQSIWTTFDNYLLPQLSIMNRCEHIYNFLVHEVIHDKHLYKVITDKDGNNLLHLAGKLAPADKLNMVTGAALQMQREIQWFEEVKKYIRPRDREAKNQKQETPIMVFRNHHNDLRKEGEEWIKKAADSYTITAALIITIVFAAAITVPGGNNGSTGKAIYENRPSFIIFVVSDAISLFTSTTSLLLFLSILTARYAEEDFLYKLPKRLIFGLVMLFMSVTTMMTAFSATLYLTLGQGKSWILIPIVALTCLPIASFVTLQLPLLVDLIFSTYGHGLFRK